VGIQSYRRISQTRAKHKPCQSLSFLVVVATSRIYATDNCDIDACERCLRNGAGCTTCSSSISKGQHFTYCPDNRSPKAGYDSIEWALMPARQFAVAKQCNMPYTTGATESMGNSLPMMVSDSSSSDFWTQFMQGEERDTIIAGIIADVDMTFDPLPPT
jgi:hypothetical protein